MHVLFVEPSFPRYQRDFVRALAEVGARVTGIGERPVEHLDGQMKSWLDGYEHVPSVVHEPSLLEAVRRIQARGWVDRLEATIEANEEEITGDLPGFGGEDLLGDAEFPVEKDQRKELAAQTIDGNAIQVFDSQIGPFGVQPHQFDDARLRDRDPVPAGCDQEH